MPSSPSLRCLSLLSWAGATTRMLPGGELLWSVADMIGLFLLDCVRLFAGNYCARGLEKCNRPKAPLILYEYEGCPYCRKVRETLSVLDIDHYVNPCPRETLKQSGYCMNSRYRPEAQRLGGKMQFPFLIDPNTDKKMYESGDINNYLWATYGAEAKAPLSYRLANWSFVQGISLKLAMFCRPSPEMGFLRATSHKADKPLELWGYESSAFVRRVREVLSRLELRYLYHVIPHGSVAKREQFKKDHGAKFSTRRLRNLLGLVQVPYLVDPNTGAEMFESSAIVEYLVKKYQTKPVENESWLEYGIDDKKK